MSQDQNVATILLYALTVSSLVNDFTEDLKVTIHTDPDLTFRQRLRESIRSRDTRSTTFYPKFDELLESFNDLVLKANEENRPQFEKRFFP